MSLCSWTSRCLVDEVNFTGSLVDLFWSPWSFCAAVDKEAKPQTQRDETKKLCGRRTSAAELQPSSSHFPLI